MIPYTKIDRYTQTARIWSYLSKVFNLVAFYVPVSYILAWRFCTLARRWWRECSLHHAVLKAANQNFWEFATIQVDLTRERWIEGIIRVRDHYKNEKREVNRNHETPPLVNGALHERLHLDTKQGPHSGSNLSESMLSWQHVTTCLKTRFIVFHIFIVFHHPRSPWKRPAPSLGVHFSQRARESVERRWIWGAL